MFFLWIVTLKIVPDVWAVIKGGWFKDGQVCITLLFMDFGFGPLGMECSGTGALRRLFWGRGGMPVEGKVALQLKDYFNKHLQDFDLELDVWGTDFQKRVWRALQEIPYGTVVTYGGLARKLGSSARAVGGAVGANPIPIVVPCHRVVGAHGEMTGFSAMGGLEAKRFLLELEGVSL